MKKKVVIIGAGPSGLTAAYNILKKNKNYEVTILEEEDTVGGISKTVNYHGNYMDLGGHRFFTKDEEINDLWNEIMPTQGKPSYDDKILKIKKNLEKGGPDPEVTNKMFLIRNRVSRIYYNKKFFDYPISLSFKTIKNLGFIKTTEAGFSYLKRVFFKKKDESNLENFYINRFGNKLYEMFFKGYTEKLWGRSPKYIDSSWGAQRVKGLSITKVLGEAVKKIFHIKSKNKETSLIEEFKYPKLGPGELYKVMADKVIELGGNILFNSKVVCINNVGNKIDSIDYYDNTNNLINIKCDYLLSSMPVKDLIGGMKGVNKNIRNIARNLPYRDFITVGIIVDKLNIKNETDIKTLNNIVPDTWIYVQSIEEKLGRIQVFNNWSPYLVKNKNTISLGLEYFCNENDEFWNKTNKQLKDYAINELIEMGIIDNDKILDYHVEKVKKAYPAYFDSYSEFDKVKDYLNTFDNLFPIGRNGQHRYNNMDHSMKTAIIATNQILENRVDKEELWNVNTEESYHEEKIEDKDIKETKENKKDKENIKEKNREFREQILNFINKFKNWNPSNASLILMGFALLFLFSTLRPFYLDNDFWFIIRTGKTILEKGFVKTELFTIHEGLKFIPHQWLTSVLFYSIYKYFNVYGMYLFMLLYNISLILLIYNIVYKLNGDKKRSFFITLVSYMLLASLFITTRPQIIDVILLLLEINFLEEYVNNNRKYIYFIPLLSFLYVNFHAATCLFIYIFILPYIAEYIIMRLKHRKVYSIIPILIVTVLSFLTSIINPYTFDSIFYLFKGYGNELISDFVYEMFPFNITVGLYILVAMGFLIYSFYRNKGHNKLRMFFFMLGTLLLSFMHIKGIIYLFIVYPIILACNFRKKYKNRGTKEINYNLSKFEVYTYLVLSIILCILMVLVQKIDHEENLKLYYAVNYLDSLNLDKDKTKIFTGYNIGGYLEWRGYKVYLDSRAEQFYKSLNGKEDIFDEYYYLTSNKVDLNDFVNKYDFDFIMVIEDDDVDFSKLDNYEVVYEYGTKLKVNKKLKKKVSKDALYYDKVINKAEFVRIYKKK